MELVGDALRLLQSAAFVLVSLWALRRHRDGRSDQAGWLAATFVSLALTVTVGLLVDLRPGWEVLGVLRRVTTAIVVPFPYFLLRFLESFEPVRRSLRRALELAIGVLAVVPFVLPELPSGDEPRSGAFAVFVLALVAVWMVVLPLVTARFWRAGNGQPTLVRRRLRTLSLASGSMSLAVLLAGADTAPGSTLTLGLQVVLLASAGLFLVGFAPPAALRTVWRQPEERELHEASLALMSATNADEVAQLLTPHLRRVIAARAAALVHDDRVLASEGLSTTELQGLRARELTGTTTLELARGAVHVWTSTYTPFFGEEELVLLGRLALLADLALDRAELLASERAARAELESANAELESFVYSASHDLKSPLIAVLSYVDVLDEEYGELLGEEGGWFVERMRSNGRYMEALVTDLLELSRVGRVDTERVDVATRDIATDIAEEVMHAHPEVVVRVGALPVLHMNPLRTRQLLRNLVENAAVHGGTEGMQIDVDVLVAAPAEGGVVLAVRDDGPGVPEAYRERVFGVFERLGSSTESGAGTGIGLAICRKIVESVGGRIWLTDHDGGAEFAIALPSTVVGPSTDVAPATEEQVAWA